jgi:hypothetical protein
LKKKKPYNNLSPVKNDDKRAKFMRDFFQYITTTPEVFNLNLVQEFLKPRTQLLHMAVLAGRNLPPKTSKGTSNVFCRVAMYNSKKKVGKALRTPVIKKTLNPIWQNPEPIVYEVNEKDDAAGGVTVSCWHRKGMGRNAFIGRIIIPFSTIPTNTQISRWFPLHPTKTYNYSKSVHGEIKLSLMIRANRLSMSSGSLEDLNTGDERVKAEQREERKAARLLKERERGMGEVHIQYIYNPPLGQWEGYLSVKVVEARNLKNNGKEINPYVVVSIGAMRDRTRTRKNTVAPTYNQNFYFYISPQEDATGELGIDVYDWSLIGQSHFIGDTKILLEDMQPDLLQDLWVVPCCQPLTQKGITKKLGKAMAEQGYMPNLPIVLVPGFASSGLEVVRGHKPWIGERVWLSLNKIGSQNIRRKIDVGRSKHAMGTLDFGTKNLWIRHLCLDPDDCHSDLEGIVVRPIQGKAAVTYLDPGLLTGSMSYVMGPLVENLMSLGYTDSNLLCAPYDWRLPPCFLEERDVYFTFLKHRIEEMRLREKKKVVILGHSMGNRTIQYFLNWIVHTTGSRKWVDDNIHTFVAVGAPFLGSSKSVRALVSGDRLGLELLLTSREAKAFGRSLGSVPSLLPISRYYDEHNIGVVHARIEEGKPHQPVSLAQFFPMAGATKAVELMDAYYRRDPCFGGAGDDTQWAILQAPPVNKLYAIYGINLETERVYFYKREPGETHSWVLDKEATSDDPKFRQFKIKKGVAYESKETEQPSLERLTGRKVCCSGDGTVSYASLNYCVHWRKQISELIIEELEGVEHREILNNRLFFKKLIEYIGEKPQKITSPNNLTIRGKKYLAQYKSDVIDDIADDKEDDDEVAQVGPSTPVTGRRGSQIGEEDEETSPITMPLMDGSVIRNV